MLNLKAFKKWVKAKMALTIFSFLLKINNNSLNNNSNNNKAQLKKAIIVIFKIYFNIN